MSEQIDIWPLSEIRQKLVILNAIRCMSKNRRNKVPAWSLVAVITGHGSSYSILICQKIGIDPDKEFDKQTPNF